MTQICKLCRPEGLVKNEEEVWADEILKGYTMVDKEKNIRIGYTMKAYLMNE